MCAMESPSVGINTGKLGPSFLCLFRPLRALPVSLSLNYLLPFLPLPAVRHGLRPVRWRADQVQGANFGLQKDAQKLKLTFVFLVLCIFLFPIVCR